MKDGDLVCDVDDIYSSISGNDPHDADLYVHEVALEMREHLLDIIRDRKGGWHDAYVPTIANTLEKLQADADRINADELIILSTPREVCMERAKERPDYFIYLIDEWFATGDEYIERCINRQG